MALQPGQQTISIHILPNISRSKGKLTMKFDQVIQYNLRNIFVEKAYTKCAGETIPRPLSLLEGMPVLFLIYFYQIHIKMTNDCVSVTETLMMGVK